ncbi:hypothetical protein RDV64_19805 [Acuticoccus sp. MNP-M23]|uniref:hypothetical protein n=1 Tax=Acuticoccus sp. MNP-M23 TaxID=3072793 RepID=UPI002815B7E9|nr:hypothetical protein [Acuticoccus sp. MNP-M23]WMS42283.1 hypothetical protein RDV64_19805 [Acuticoccus sp. MNP-M23]
MDVVVRPWRYQRSKVDETRSVTIVVETDAGVGTVPLPLPFTHGEDKDADFHEALRAFAEAVNQYAATKPPYVRPKD